MKRREFLQTSAMLTAGTILLPKDIVFAKTSNNEDNIFQLFKNPPSQYHPFVCWWWNGNYLKNINVYL